MWYLPVLFQMNSSTQAPSSDSRDQDGFDLYDGWRMLKEFRRLIGAIALGCLALFAAAAFLMPLKYRAEVLVVPVEEGKVGGGLSALAGQFGGLAELAGVNLGGGAGRKETSVAYLGARVFIEGFVKDKNLLPVLFASDWDAGAGKWKEQDENKVPTTWDAYQFISKHVLSVEMDKKTGLVTLAVEWKDRGQAVEWANELISRANLDLRRAAIAETESSLAYLQQELTKTDVVEVRQAIFKVMESQFKTKMLANVQEQFAFKVIDPAAPMGADAFVKPKRLLLIALGLVCGVLLGVLTAFVLSIRRLRDSSV